MSDSAVVQIAVGALLVALVVTVTVMFFRQRAGTHSTDFTIHHIGSPIVLPEHWNELTRREKQVAVYAARGLRNADIAKELDLSQHTVESHVKHAYAKLGVHNRIELVHLLRDVEMND